MSTAVLAVRQHLVCIRLFSLLQVVPFHNFFVR